MIVNVAYAAISAVMIIALGRRGLPRPLAVLLVPFPVLVLILVGEVTPKMLAYRLGERWALTAALPIAVFKRIFAPIVWILEKALVSPLCKLVVPKQTPIPEITSEELAGLLDLSAKRGLIGPDANALLREIMHLGDIRVADIMVPRVDIIAYDVNESPSGLADLFAKTRLRKVPVYDGEIDNVLGVVHAKRTLLDPSRGLRDLVSPVPFVPETARIERTLMQLRHGRDQMAIAVDEYGGVAGLVTLEDIVEEIVGDIEETQDAPQDDPVRRIGENEYLIDGNLPIHEWVEAFQIELIERRISTIGGFVTSLLRHIPEVGDVARYRNLHFTVERMRRRRISTLRLKLLEEAT
jgi:CBS domain containing-hemolysin-like protein